jgi:hypothetical protein
MHFRLVDRQKIDRFGRSASRQERPFEPGPFFDPSGTSRFAPKVQSLFRFD